jgi:hypothetical protein
VCVRESITGKVYWRRFVLTSPEWKQAGFGMYPETIGTFQFSGLGITFKWLTCQATLWVLVFIRFSAAFLAMMKFVS